MAWTSQLCHALMLNLFNNTAAATWGDGTGFVARGTTGSLYHTLLSADPTAAGTSQTTSELSYTGYNASARPGLALSSAGYTVGTAGAVSNADSVTWGACTASTGTANFVGIGNAASSTGYLLMAGAVTSPLSISTGITPSAAIGAITITLS